MTNYLLIAIIILLPLQFALNVGQNFDLVTTRILIPILFLFWLARSLAKRKIWIPSRAETWLLVLFLFLASLSLAIGKDAGMGFRKLAYFFSIIPVYFVASDVFREGKWKNFGVAAIVISGSIGALVALLQFSIPFLFGIEKAVKIWEGLAPYFLGNSFGKLVASNASWLVNIGGQTRMRAFGFFPDPHNFAFFVNLCFFVALGYFAEKIKQTSKILVGIGIILMFVASLLSFSRGGYLGLLSSLIFFSIIFLKRAGFLGKALIAASIICLLLFFYNSSLITQRLASSFDLREGSNAERYKNWVEAVDIIEEYPLGGVGLGNYARTVEPMAEERSSIYAHDLYLDIAAETGILNALIFIMLLEISVWRNVRNGRMLSLGIAAGLVGFSVHSVFDTALYSPQVLSLLLVIIALGVISNGKLKSQNEK